MEHNRLDRVEQNPFDPPRSKGKYTTDLTAGVIRQFRPPAGVDRERNQPTK